MPRTRKQRAVIYCSVATEGSVKDDNSLEKQGQECFKVALKRGFNVSGFFMDVGTSKRSLERQGLQNMLAFCKDKKNRVKYVITTRFDRLCRSAIDNMKIADELDKLDIKILINGIEHEFNSAGNLQHNILLAMMSYEKELKSERIKAGRQHKREQLLCQTKELKNIERGLSYA